MKIKPSTKEIYTDTGKFVKRLHCPIHVKWKAMKKNGDRSKLNNNNTIVRQNEHGGGRLCYPH